MSEEKKQKWTGTTHGNRWMHRNLTGTLRWMDVRLIYLCSALFIVPFCLFLPTSKYGYKFLRTAFGQSRLKALAGTYTNVRLFSTVVIDRFAMYAGQKFDIVMKGYEHFERLAKQKEGFVQLSAHIGNYELAGYNLVAKDKRMHALVYGGEKEFVMDERDKMLEASRIGMIAIKPDMSHIFEVNEVLAKGEIVSMPADRMTGSLKKVSANFFGRQVNLPAGPFTVAAMRGCDVLAVNVMKSAMRQYTIQVTPLTYDKQQSRQEQVKQLAQAYATEMERMVRKYPHQWYNYYDFWNQ